MTHTALTFTSFTAATACLGAAALALVTVPVFAAYCLAVATAWTGLGLASWQAR